MSFIQQVGVFTDLKINWKINLDRDTYRFLTRRKICRLVQETGWLLVARFLNDFLIFRIPTFKDRWRYIYYVSRELPHLEDIILLGYKVFNFALLRF